MERDLQEIVGRMVTDKKFKNNFLDPQKRTIILKKEYFTRLSSEEYNTFLDIVAKNEQEFAQALIELELVTP